jgi:glycosyltransferase involved in cell wall biosynthesis
MRILIWAGAIWGSGWSIWWIFFAQQAFKFRNEQVWLHNLSPEKSPRSKSTWPSVTVIAPACNEAKDIERCMNTLLQQDYPSFDIIAINDRSSDDTGEILDRLAKKDNRLKSLHIDKLPPGWMGRCHAFDMGGRQATGDYMLFLDADAFLDPSVLRRTILFMEKESVDYISILSKRICINVWEKVFIIAFFNLMSSLGPVWKVRHPSSHVSIGIGSFALFRRKVFEQINGMRNLRLSISDDQALAAAVKAHGFSCRLLLAENLLESRWQDGLKGHILGLEKNGFATFGFNYFLAVRMLIRNFSLNFSPFLSLVLGMLLSSIPIVLISLSGIFSIWILTFYYHRQIMRRPNELLFLPLGCLFFGVSLLWSTWRTFSTGGCKWKNQFYPLEDLMNHFTERAEWLKFAWASQNSQKMECREKPPLSEAS